MFPHPSDRYLNLAVVDLVLASQARRVLDVGCGNVALARRLADAGLDVTGVDWDPKAVQLASKRVPQAHFEVARFSDQPPACDFDAVVSTEVIEHLFDPDELLQFALRALRPGGTLVLSTPHHGYLKNLVLSLTNGWDKHFMTDVLAGHIKFFSRRTLTAALERNGFTVRRFAGAGRLPFLWKSMILTATKPQGSASQPR
jgi:2-polyprenyl-3-methyl-5-hydroxy-6-metoxy-1,4-benzoquinol methylase